MKKLIILAGVFLGTQVMAADVDYSYCNDSLARPFGLSSNNYEGFPFSISKDGKIKTHEKINSYKIDEKLNAEIIEYGEKPYITKLTIIKDESGKLSKVIQTNEFKAKEQTIGVGAKNKGFGVYGPGQSGYGMGMMPIADTEMNMVTDIKIQNGKCFPYRSLMETKTGKLTQRHFVSDVQLCRDIKEFFKKNPQAASCFDPKLNAEMSKVLGGHHKRNEDVYDPKSYKKKLAKEKKEGVDPFSDDEEYDSYDGKGFNSPGFGYPGMGGVGMVAGGGYGMFLDNMIPQEGQNNLFNQAPIINAQSILSMQCGGFFPNSPIVKMIADDELFKEEVQAIMGKEGNSIQK